MIVKNNNQSDSENSTLQMLQEINSGLTDPKLLDKQNRQRCIEQLVAEGYSYTQMAQTLKCSEKTICRDVKEIRARNELAPNLEFAKQFVGEVFQRAMNHNGYLMCLARSKDASIAEKTQAESAAWKILKELTERFQSLGYLPSRPTEVVGTFYHQSSDSDDSSPETMRKMLLGIEEGARDMGLLDKDVTAKIETLKTRIAQSEITVEIKQLEENISNVQEQNNEKEN